MDPKTQQALYQIQTILRNPLLPRTQALQQIQGIVSGIGTASSIVSSLQSVLRNGNVSSLAGQLQAIGGILNSASPDTQKPVIGSHEWQAKLAPHVGTIKNVSFVPDNGKRGVGTSSTVNQGYDGEAAVPAPPTRPSSMGGAGLTIHRSGAVSGAVYGGSDLTITVEGGSSEWEGANTNTNVDSYFTRAQLATCASIRKFLLVYCPSVVVNSEGVF